MAAVRPSHGPPTPDKEAAAGTKKNTAFLDSMEEEMRRVSEHLERREQRLGLRKGRWGTGEIVNGYSFSEGSGAEAGARRSRRRINHYSRQLRPSDEDRSSESPDPRTPSPGPRSAPPVHPSRSFFSEQLPVSGTESATLGRASPAERRTPDRWGSRESQQDDPELMKLKDEDTPAHVVNRPPRPASSSPLRKFKSPPPPVAPKPKSRRSPGPPSPQLHASSEPFRRRAVSAPPRRPRSAGERDKEDRVTPNKEEGDKESPQVEPQVVEQAAMEEDSLLLDSAPTPVPEVVPEPSPSSPPLTPEPSELMVVHQHLRAKSSTPERSSSSSADSSSTLSLTLSPTPGCLEVGEARAKEAASPGIIEISGNFSFGKRRTPDRRGERSVSPIAEEAETREPEESQPTVDEVAEKVEITREEVELPNTGNTLLDATMEGEGQEGEEGEGEGPGETEEYEEAGGDSPCEEEAEVLAEVGEGSLADHLTEETATPPLPQTALAVLSSPETGRVTADPQGPEIKSLPKMSPGAGRRSGPSPGQRRRRSQEELQLMVRDLQLQLREREEEAGRQRRAAERDATEKEQQIGRLTRETQKLEREKWELLKRARDGAERSLSLRTQLDLKESLLRSLQADLGRTRDELISVKSANTSLRALLGELRAPKPSKDVGVQASLGGGTLRRNNSMELAVHGLAQPASTTHLERGIDFRASTTNLDRGTHHRVSNCSAMSEGWPGAALEQQRNSGRWEREQSVTSISSSLFGGGSREGTPTQTPQPGKKMKKKRGPLFGKLRKSVGKRGSTPTIIDGVDLTQSSLIQGQSRTPISFPYQTRVSADTQEHWRVLEEARHVPFQHWNGRAIVAWVTTGLGMSQYTAVIREHVTTGNAMLALSDSDMDKKLGLATVLHRRKLRLAIEEQRRPDRVHYPLAGRIDCGWLAEVWTTDIGLPYLADAMTMHLVDGRVLDSLTKDDLKKHLKMSKKLEQMSFLSGVELLRMHEYNREAVLEHRAGQQNPLYWTNRDVGDWLRDIQLGDYVSNLLGSGVHGALLFLERGEKGRFSAEHLAQVLQLPGGKSPARKHLSQQMARLFREEGSESPFRTKRISVNSFQSNPPGVSPVPSPYSFSGYLYRAGSSPSLNQTMSQTEKLEERIRHSLRESALRSVAISPHSSSPPSHSPSPSSPIPHPPSPGHPPSTPSPGHPPSTPSPLTRTTTGTTV